MTYHLLLYLRSAFPRLLGQAPSGSSHRPPAGHQVPDTDLAALSSAFLEVNTPALEFPGFFQKTHDSSH